MLLERTEQRCTERLTSNPGDVQAWLDRGVARLRLNRAEEGVKDLERAVSLDSKSADAHAALAYGLWAVNRLDEAMQEAQAALRIDPTHGSANFYAGRILLATGGNATEAISYLEKAAERIHEQVDLNLALFTAYRQAHDIVREAYQLRFLGHVLPPNHAAYTYSEGLLQADLGNLPLAIRYFRQALASDPNLLRAQQDLGVALAKTSQWKEAAEVLGPLAQKDPNSVAAAYFYALALENTGRGGEAEREARRLIELSPRSAEGYTILGIILSAQARHTEAAQVLESAAQIAPGDFEVQFYLGRARYALGDNGGARAAFEAALQAKPDDYDARFFLATVMEAEGEKEKAIGQYLELIRLQPEDARGYIGVGALQTKYGDRVQGLANLRKGYELQPDSYEAALALGRELARQEAPEEGLKLLRQAVQQAPDSPEAHYQLGLALRRAGRETEAQEEFSTVQRLNEERRGGKPQDEPASPRNH